LPLAAWYGWHYFKTGFLFGNPEFLRYNAQATLDPLRMLAAFGHRILHLTAHMKHVCAGNAGIAAMLLIRGRMRKGASGPRSGAGSGAHPGFAGGECGGVQRVGGALLTRYLLPMYPLVLLVAVTAFIGACLSGSR